MSDNYVLLNKIIWKEIYSKSHEYRLINFFHPME